MSSAKAPEPSYAMISHTEFCSAISCNQRPEDSIHLGDSPLARTEISTFRIMLPLRWGEILFASMMAQPAHISANLSQQPVPHLIVQRTLLLAPMATSTWPA